EHQVARHPRELGQTAIVAPVERADDVLDVPAGTERLPRARQHDCANLRLGVERANGLAKLVVDLEVERVEAIGTIQGDPRHPARGIVLVQKRGRRFHGSTAVASISTAAPSSTSAVTATSDIAG